MEIFLEQLKGWRIPGGGLGAQSHKAGGGWRVAGTERPARLQWARAGARPVAQATVLSGRPVGRLALPSHSSSYFWCEAENGPGRPRRASAGGGGGERVRDSDGDSPEKVDWNCVLEVE